MAKQIHIFCIGGPYDGHHLYSSESTSWAAEFTESVVLFSQRQGVGKSFMVVSPKQFDLMHETKGPIGPMHKHTMICRSESENEIHLTIQHVQE